MEIITASHVDMEKKVLNPYRGICCSIIWFNIHGFKPFWAFVLHYLVSEAKGVCGASVSGHVAT